MRVRRARGGQHGFTILEVVISATIFLLVSGAVVTSLVLSNALNLENRETSLASRAAQSIVEELKGTDFQEVFARYNSTKDDDPGAGESPGNAFDVPALPALADDEDGLAGRIEFPGPGDTLREDLEDDDLGLPRDLNGDGEADSLDHAGDYRILPVRVVVEWDGKGGPQSLELVTVLTEL